MGFHLFLRVSTASVGQVQGTFSSVYHLHPQTREGKHKLSLNKGHIYLKGVQKINYIAYFLPIFGGLI